MLAKLEPHQILLLRAAVIIGERGHCQGRVEDPEQRLCVMGALAAAVRAMTIEGGAHPSLIFWQAEKALTGYLGMAPMPWNDMPGRTAEEAIAALEGAATF